MTREQEITTMGAHAARTSETGPTTTAARIATTTLAVAVTGVVGSGTALAHDDGAGQHGGHGHHAASATSGDPAGEARTEAQQTVRDTLADLGLPFSGASDPDSDSDEQWDSADAQDPSSDDHDSSGHSDGHGGEAPSAPSSGATAAETPRPSVQPIAASSGPAQLPPVGETTTVPIR